MGGVDPLRVRALDHLHFLKALADLETRARELRAAAEARRRSLLWLRKKLREADRRAKLARASLVGAELAAAEM